MSLINENNMSCTLDIYVVQMLSSVHYSLVTDMVGDQRITSQHVNLIAEKIAHFHLHREKFADKKSVEYQVTLDFCLPLLSADNIGRFFSACVISFARARTF